MNDPKCSCGSLIEDAMHYLLECKLYYNQRISLSLLNDLINMNIQINIETLLFGNDTNTDQTNSFFLIRFFFIKQTKKVSSFRLLFCFFSDFALFPCLH